MTRIRTLEFLPSIFQTTTNSQFLGATLDQLVNPPSTKIIQGYVGSKVGYGIDARDYYVTEPTKVRTDYQLEPGVVFLKDNETTAKDFISYPGIIDSLKLQNSVTNNNNNLFNSDIYSFDSFCSLDPIINYNQYYWLPEGPPPVTVAASTVFNTNDYIVRATSGGYNIRTVGAGAGSINPTLTLLRGGTYNFIVDQNTKFWIQGEPGVTGFSPIQNNLYTRDIYGVTNNGAEVGVVTFNVPEKDAQNEFNYPGNNQVAVVSTLPYSQVNGARLADIGSIDGVTALNGRTVMFYDTGVENEIAYSSVFYDESNYDTNLGTLVGPRQVNITQTFADGTIKVNTTAPLTIGGTLILLGPSIGGLQSYQTDPASVTPATDMVVGKTYYISDLGDTDWVAAGVTSNAVINAEIDGNQLIIDNVISGGFSIGQTLVGAGVANGTIITGYDMIASANNGKPTYTVNINQNVSLTNMSVFDIQVGKIFVCASVPTVGNGFVGLYNPVIYYVTAIDPSTNTIKVSLTLNGPTFITTSGTGLMRARYNSGLYEEGLYTEVNNYFYTIQFLGENDDPVLRLVPSIPIPLEQKITPQYGEKFVGLHFIKSAATGAIIQLPYISAPLDTLYYQDGTNPNSFGVIKLIESNETNTIDVNLDIIGKKNYTSTNGVIFTNGLKVEFDGDVFPRSYLTGQYYVEGVGTEKGIELISTDLLVTPEPFTTSTTSPYDALPYDIGPYDAGLNIPTEQDYITIARNSINRNAWSRSNRWFHIQVIENTAAYNNNAEILTTYATADNKAKRPILQFYPNLKLFNSGTIAKNDVDFIDFRTSNAFDFVESQQSYYPDVQTYTEYKGTILANYTVNMTNVLAGQWYQIEDLDNGVNPETNIYTWTDMGATVVNSGDFEVGVQYIITQLGTTPWTTIGGPGVYTKGTVFTCINPGPEGAAGGTGAAIATIFKPVQSGIISSNRIRQGLEYTIVSLGTTQWTDLGFVGTPTVGATFAANVPGFNFGDVITSVGTGTVYQGSAVLKNKSITTVQVPVDAVVGHLQIGQWINDMILGQESRLPAGTRILDISTIGSNYNIEVYWTLPQDIIGHTYNPLVTNSGASFAINDEDNADLNLFAGSRIVFAGDVNESIRNKIYVVNFSNTGSELYPVITLTEAEDSQVLEDDQFPVQKGYNHTGHSYYFNGSFYIQAQQKMTVNEAPLFDLFDENGISYGDSSVYPSSTFNGCKLFNYKSGAGANDAVLGFPISFSSINNVGDISFEVSLYTDEFNYVSDSGAVTSKVSNGFVYDYIDRIDYKRLTGWQTCAAPSQQYQVFEFEYYANEIPVVLSADEFIEFTVTCDVPQASEASTVWPSLEVFNNNNILVKGTDYTVINTTTETKITVKIYEDIDTPIQVLILSDSVSNKSYYSIPVNLSNNPFNVNPETIDIGDIRGQYQTIFTNNPNTSGQMFGPNNYRDLGNLVPWGNRIIQNSASLVLPGAFLRDPSTNLFDSLLFNSREYIKFKTLLIDTVNRIAYDQKYDPSTLLDLAVDEITSVKSQEQPFFWSDMLPSKAAFITNVYSFANDQDTSIFPLSKIYDFNTANYDGVLVYLQRKVQGVQVIKQLLRGIDYLVSTDSPSVILTKDLLNGDRVIIKEYNKTYGSYVPNTPTKLGLYPAYIPSIVYDESYVEPTYFIQGHDGSYNKMYGEYNEELGMPVDFRDQVLLEYETRVYNNLKLSRVLPIVPAAIIPGYFRQTPLSYEQYTEVYSTNFLDWVGQNRIDYKTQLFLTNDPYTYNYRGSRFKLDGSAVMQGNWRGIYTYLYDTSTPDTTPWEMIGYANKPDWWETRYGPAPYTSDNLILWEDMENGYDFGTNENIDIFKRPGLMNILPVDSAGELRQPLDAVIANYNSLTFQRKWMVGDDAPAEYSYRKSSTYPFDLMRLQALIKPALFYNLGSDLDNYKYSPEFDQFLVNGRTHLVPSNIEIYGNGTAKTSYINWIVDYQKQLGVDATEKIKKLLTNLDVRLVYRLAGFSDKNLLRFFVEKGSPTTPNPSLMIPDESYQVLLYENQPSDKIVYSGVVIQKTIDGYAVYGNNQTSAYFRVLKPEMNGSKTEIIVQDATVSIADTYSNKLLVVPYGTVFYTEQDVSQFLMSYGRYLETQGMKFEYMLQGLTVTWPVMIQEFLYWAQSGWSPNSVLTLNPAADNIVIDKESLIVQPLTYTNNNFILNNNLYPIQTKDLCVFRDGTQFSVKPMNEGDVLSYGQFNLSNIEHGIVFNNITLFGDVVYNLASGLKQNRIYVRGTKSADWDGTMFASGFIYNQDNIQEWKPGVKYTKGAIVTYKNKYYAALSIVQPNAKFIENEWKITDYDEIQKGLLPNSSTRSYESALYYNSNKANLESDADQLSFSLIGFRPRDYMVSADLTDITQVNVYKNLIKDKGTLNALKAFKGANLPQGGIDYDIYENWAIQQGSYGGLLNNNFIEFKLSEKSLTGNPAIIGLSNGNYVDDAQQLVPIYSLFNYGYPISSPNVLPLTYDRQSAYFPDAGYVNINDVKMSAYYYSNLPSAVNKNGIIVPIDNLYVGDYVWLANYRAGWRVLTPDSTGQVVQVRANLNNTCTVTFAADHNLSQYDIFAIINFDALVNGYYVVTNVRGPREVLINLALPAQTRSLTGNGIAMKFNSQRVEQPSDIQNLPLLTNEFVKNTVWVDENIDGNWAVYRKDISYQYDRTFDKDNSIRFGASVAYTKLSDYLFGDPDKGEVYRYQYDELEKAYVQDQTLTGSTSFGTTIVHEQNIFAISQPTGTPKVELYVVNDTAVSDDIIPYQTINAVPGSTNFGQAMAMSGDTNFLFISDFNDTRNNVHVYRKNNLEQAPGGYIPGMVYQIKELGNNPQFKSSGAVTNEVGIYFVATTAGTGTGKAIQCDYEYIATLTSGSVDDDKFGHSISTNYYGTSVFVGAPNEDYELISPVLENWGRTYVYNRLTQNILMNTEYNSVLPPSYTLAWNPVAGQPFSVTKNGTTVSDSNYTIVGNVLTYTGVFTIGDILNISGNEFVNVQILETGETPRIGVGFGTSVDNNTHGTEVVVGAPFALSSNNQEGAGYRFTDAGSRFGVITGTQPVDTTATRQILINGFLVNIPAGDAVAVATAINTAKILNVVASENNGILILSVIDQDLSTAESKLVLTVNDPVTLTELGIQIYSPTQVILCPHEQGATRFGTVVKFNEHNSVAISAPVGTRFSQTTFDFSDDENLDNDTVFDNNSTQFIDTFRNAGAVYIFDYLSNYNESLNNIGAYTYAQSVNSKSLVNGASPRYGSAIDWIDNKIVVGAPDFLPESIDGQVVIYVNETGVDNWHVLRQSSEIVDIDRIQNLQLFSAETNNTLVNLDYIDPLQGKLLGAVRTNIDVISNADPASYNNSTSGTGGIVWGEAQVGTVWLDTTNIRYMNYHQNDNAYNAKYWGQLFPGSDVAVYSWIGSTVPPASYTGTGIPKDITNYTVQTVLNSSNTIQPVYYFWVRDSGLIFRERGKTIADINIASYIANPQTSGISYLAPLASDAVAIYNCKPFINANDTVLHIGYSNGIEDNPAHQEFTLIRQDYADDFLPGLPGTGDYLVPESLYDRMLDSLSGVDEQGAVVPNPFLPKAVQSGVLARPRQSFFYNRYEALKNYIQYANGIMALYPIVELRENAVTGFLQQSGEYFDTTMYWERVNWWALGYDNNTKAALQVPIYADLSALNVPVGTIVTVSEGQTSLTAGNAETYRYDGLINDQATWTRIGLENGTIEFSSKLYDYEAAGYGFAGTFYDTDSYDLYPSEETRWIIRALTEQIYTDDLLIHRNKSLILLFEYIQEETVENQNYLPWLNKTSLIDVSHKIRELRPLQNYLSDNQEFLSGYVNEVKPYHVVVKEFLFEYTGGDVYPGTITDFDLPSEFNTTIDKFVSPQLVYDTAVTPYEYSANSAIWQTEKYKEWYNNFGIGIGQYLGDTLVGETDYPIAKLKSYMTVLTDTIVVDNAQGFPINGTFKIYDLSDSSVYEVVGYSYVDRSTNVIGGLSRGLQGTTPANHLPNTQIVMDLPPVILLDGGKGYSNPPRIIATIPEGYPEPRVEATFEAQMSGDSISSIIVTDPGSGYVVTPQIVIDSAYIYEFDTANVSVINNTIEIYAPELATGDLVKYVKGTTNVGGLQDNKWYYINVLDSSPTTIIALYSTDADALNDTNRVKLLSQGTGTQKFELGARALAIPNSSPVRENNITIKFDRTSYDTQVKDWTPNTFYSGEFVGYYTQEASSNISLASVQPDINNILSSAEGTVFPIQSVINDRQLEWSSGPGPDGRRITQIVGNKLVLSFTSSPGDSFPSGSTVGFTVGMPVRFTGNVPTDITAGQTYYIAEVIDLANFTISETQGGPVKSIANYTPTTTLNIETANIIDTAVITTTYPGIRQVIATNASDNTITISLTDIGTAGTEGMYQTMPIYFTGNVFGGIEANKIYYVVTVLNNQQFTISEKRIVPFYEVTQMTLANQLIIDNTGGLEVGQRIFFNNLTINNEPVDTFGNIVSNRWYFIKTKDNNVITISETLGGPTFTTGIVNPGSGNYCFLTSQEPCTALTTETGEMTASLSVPLSPGQVNGQSFTFYPTSQNYSDIDSVIYGNQISKTIIKTLEFNSHNANTILSGNQLAIEPNASYLYNGIPFSVSEDIGGLIRLDALGNRKVYYATNLTNISININNTTASTLVFNGSAADDELTVTTVTSGTGFLYPGTQIVGSGVELNTYIEEQLSGTPGREGVYRISRTYFVPATLTGISATTGVISCAPDYFTDMIFEGMPITFTGLTSFGGILLNFKYYVRHIIDDSRFTVTPVLGQSAASFTIGNGTLTGTGSPAMQAYLPAGEFLVGQTYEIRTIGTTNYTSIGATVVNAGSFFTNDRYIIKSLGNTNWNAVADTTGVSYQVGDIIIAKNAGTGNGQVWEVQFTATGVGSGTGTAIVVLTGGTGPSTWEQQIVKPATFDIGYVLGGYNVIVNDGGLGFTQTNTITIKGDQLGGTTPANDLTITVSRINPIVPGTYSWSLPVTSDGAITKVSCSGTPIGTTAQYFLKVRSENELEVYSDPLMREPVSGFDFPYTGYVTTNVVEVLVVSGSPAYTDIILSDASEFAINDLITFTNIDHDDYDINNGSSYYIVFKSGNTIRVSTNPGGDPISIANLSIYPTNALVAKPGSFMLLPEPFYFDPSIVKYNNRVWMCTISNNDPEFVIGKWVEMDSADPRLNALDRAKGYYAPTTDMPGNNLEQLFTGLTYENTIYRGNQFERDKQFALDTHLVDRPFDPSNLNMPAVVYDGTNYLAPANLPNIAGIVADLEITDDWMFSKMSDQTLSFTDLIHSGDLYVMTSSNSPTPIFTSPDYQVWSTSGWFVPVNTPIADIEFDKKRLISAGLTLNGAAYKNGQYMAVGKNILISDDATYWYEKFVLTNPNQIFNGCAIVNINNFVGYVAVGQFVNDGLIYISNNGNDWTRIGAPASRRCYAVTSGFNNMFIACADGVIFYSPTGEVWASTSPPFSNNADLLDIVFANDTLVAVGEEGLVVVSTDGVNWSVKATPTTETLNSVMYVPERNEWTIVGNNNVILQTNNITASVVTWDTTHLFTSSDPEYTIMGDSFQSGYGPEEMVPGIVTDNLTMVVNTRAGTNYPATQYAHSGYNVVSVELDRETDNVYSFKDVVQTPATIGVFKLVNGLSTSLYETIDYAIDWIAKTVTLVDALTVGQMLRIDVYEVGNGDQLVKSNTETDPIERNRTTGFDEIDLHCNYVGLSYTGGGIVNPGSETLYVNALQSNSTDDTIFCLDVSNFTVNGEITFTGTVFGGVAINTPYYVKSINEIRKTITISESLVGGVAGPVFPVSTDGGYMTVVIQKGPGDPFTEPAVFYNGNKLQLGRTNYVISTNAANNGILTFTTSNLIAGQKIRFSDDIFGGITAHTTYYVKDVLSATEFTISATLGGPIFALSSAAGNAIFVTEDYAIGLSDDQVTAKMILADRYNALEDYLSYSFFNQTDPQYGYALPRVQTFNGNNTVGPFELDNYLGGFNPQNAIVEVNGLRVDPNDYEVSFAFQQLEFNSRTPSDTDVISVTTYNDTQQQYLFTTSYDTTNKKVAAISSIITLTTVTQPTARVITTEPHGLVSNDVVRIDGVSGSTQANNQLFIVEKLSDNQVRIYGWTPGVTSYGDGSTVTELSTYTGGGYVWKYQSWMLENMYATSCDGTYLTVAEVDGLVANTAVYFTEENTAIGSPLTSIPELIAGQKYYIKEINEFTNKFSISEFYNGAVIDSLTIGSGYDVRVTQWQQTNVDRLWVTVNGYRVASSQLRINPGNDISILAEVENGDEVVITSMVPSATPDTQTYIQIVDRDGQGSVFRANTETRTWVVSKDPVFQPFKGVGRYDKSIKVHDISKITNLHAQNNTAPVSVDNKYMIGLNADKNDILLVRIYNHNPARQGFIDEDYIFVETSGLGPFAVITAGDWIQPGDELTLTVWLGKTLYVNGEYMIITGIDTMLNIVDVQRGAYGSPINDVIPVNTIIYSLLEDNKMTQINYDVTWNTIPGVYNTNKGDPLQIAQGSAASFLRVDVS